jgi:hypothetical protein
MSAEPNPSPKKDKPKRKTSEKPVSLHPVDFEDALRDLLATPPPPKEQTTKKKKRKK